LGGRQKAWFLPAALVYLVEIACGDFNGHRSFSAGKKRGFCQLRLRKTVARLWGDC
jgi:hypothetical protein